MDPDTGTMIRTGVTSVVNPLDLYAIECALRIVEEYGGRVTAITMGPPPAERALREAIAIGCTDAVLVSDRGFRGADTWATSYTLSRAIETLGAYDLIITGERATDGDTAQVGPGIAAWLDIPLVTYAAHVQLLQEKRVRADRLVEDGYQHVEVEMPVLLTVVKEIARPRLATLRGKRRAIDAEIPVLDADAIGADRASIGLSGSPTRVVRIETPKVTRGGIVVSAKTDEEVRVTVARLLSFLEQRGLR
jgi:electron transfer flavoprotein beta subunit